MSLPITKSYADETRSLEGGPSVENTLGTLDSSANLINSSASNGAPRSASIETIGEPLRDHPRNSTRSGNPSPQPTPRRPSIAQVLGRTPSRSSQASGMPSRLLDIQSNRTKFHQDVRRRNKPDPRIAAEGHQAHERMEISFPFFQIQPLAEQLISESNLFWRLPFRKAM